MSRANCGWDGPHWRRMRSRAANERFTGGGAICLQLGKFCHLGPPDPEVEDPGKITQIWECNQPGPSRAREYFCQNPVPVKSPEPSGQFLKKSENWNAWKSGPQTLCLCSGNHGFSGTTMLALWFSHASQAEEQILKKWKI